MTILQEKVIAELKKLKEIHQGNVGLALVMSSSFAEILQVIDDQEKEIHALRIALNQIEK